MNTELAQVFCTISEMTVNQSQKLHHLNIQTLAVTVKALNQCFLMPGCLGCVSCRMMEIICAYPANEKPTQNSTMQDRYMVYNGKRAENILIIL